MGKNIEDNLATMAKANFGIQFVRLVSGQIGLMQFLSFAIFRPIKFVIGGFLLIVFVILIPIEAYCWYIEHTSFTYHLIKGDLESISGKNSRTRRHENQQQVVEIKEDKTESMQKSNTNKEKYVPSETAIENKIANVMSTESTAQEQMCRSRSLQGINDPTIACMKEVLKVADAELNNTYKMALWVLSATDSADLRIDERNWIKSRDRTCSALDEASKTKCLIEQTELRNAYIKKLMPQS